MACVWALPLLVDPCWAWGLAKSIDTTADGSVGDWRPRIVLGHWQWAWAQPVGLGTAAA